MSALEAQGVSRREQDVLDAVAEHLTNAEIAQRLHISIRTVESHVTSLLRKLGAVDRRELARMVGDARLNEPAPRAIAGLPAQLTSFVGRASEVQGLRQLLGRQRLVTLVGPGGVGKTRLAVEVARNPNDSWSQGGFVNLVPVGPGFVIEAVAGVFGVGQRPDESLEDVLLQRLRGSRCLLILDNCEHLLAPAAALVSSVLEACPDAVILATSRQRLDLPGERVFSVTPLRVTAETGPERALSESAALFADRSGSPLSDSDVELVVEICRRLEGMPLAIELAAARRDSLGLDGLLAGIDDHLRLLTRSAGDIGRHGSLRSVINWSHDLLHDDEKMVFRRLGMFQGPFDLPAAHLVTGTATLFETGDLVGRLTDQSLLIRNDERSGSRWRMLDSIRAFARDQLVDLAEYEQTLTRHRQWAVRQGESLVDSLRERDDWQVPFDAVADDLRSAVKSSPPGDAGFALAMALGRLAFARRYLAEARQHMRSAVELAPDAAAAISALRLTAGAAFSEMRGELAYDLLLEATARAEAAGDKRMAAVVLAHAAGLAVRCPALFVRPLTAGEVEQHLNRARELGSHDDLELETYLAIAEAWRGETGLYGPRIAPASRALKLARLCDDPRLITVALDALAGAHTANGRHREAARLTDERVWLLDRLARDDPTAGGEIVDTFHMATETAICTGALNDALAIARRQVGDEATFGLAHFAAKNLVITLVLKGEFDDAVEQADVMLAGWEDAGRPPAAWMGPSFYAAALVHGLRSDAEKFAEWCDHGRRVSGEGPLTDFARYTRLRVALHGGDLQQVESETLSRSFAHAPYAAFTVAVRAEAAIVAGWDDRDEKLGDARRCAVENDFIAAHVARIEGRMTDDQQRLERSVQMWDNVGARFERACTLFYLTDRAEEGVQELAALGCRPPVAVLTNSR